MITFTVYGQPQPQGSMRAFLPKGSKRPILTSDNPKLKSWRQETAIVALSAMRGSVLIQKPAAVKVEASFFFQRPKSVKGIHKVTKPDSDKLLRGLLDALKGICFEDDSQVCECRVTKGFAETPHTIVWVTMLDW